jgi:hypothetical protein
MLNKVLIFHIVNIVINRFFYQTHLGFTKVFVANGQIASKKNDEMEIVDLENPNSKCLIPPKFPFKRMATIGGLGPDKNPIICGGFGTGPETNW